MKIFLVNPSAYGKLLSIDPILTRCSGVPAKAPYLWPPIGLAYIASYIREMADVKILDAQAESLDDDNIVKRCRGADLVVFSTSTQTINKDLKLCKKIKKNGSKIALIGGHATFFHSTLIKNKSIDFVVRGEPEKILFNLSTNFKNLEKIKGLTWKDGRKIIINKDEPLTEDLNQFPFADRSLLPNDKYYDILAKKRPITFMITSRGCPFNCTFCSSHIYGKKYRYRSAENVVEEMEDIVSHGFKDISIFDDTFTINRERVLDIAKLIKHLDISWRCLSRVDTVDKEMLEKMYDSGCYQVQFGVESGDERILNLMRKNISIQKTKDVFKWCDEIGIETVGFFILGYPEETRESIEKTINLAEEIQPDFVTFNLLTPLPGSEIFETLKPRKKWENFDFTSTSFCGIPSKEMQEIVAEAYRNYYVRVSYLLKRIWKTKDPYRIIKQNIVFWTKKSGTLWEFLNR